MPACSCVSEQAGFCFSLSEFCRTDRVCQWLRCNPLQAGLSGVSTGLRRPTQVPPTLTDAIDGLYHPPSAPKSKDQPIAGLRSPFVCLPGNGQWSRGWANRRLLAYCPRHAREVLEQHGAECPRVGLVGFCCERAFRDVCRAKLSTRQTSGSSVKSNRHVVIGQLAVRRESQRIDAEERNAVLLAEAPNAIDFDGERRVATQVEHPRGCDLCRRVFACALCAWRPSTPNRGTTRGIQPGRDCPARTAGSLTERAAVGDEQRRRIRGNLEPQDVVFVFARSAQYFARLLRAL